MKVLKSKKKKETGTNLALLSRLKKFDDSLKTNLQRPMQILQFLTRGKIQ